MLDVIAEVDEEEHKKIVLKNQNHARADIEVKYEDDIFSSKAVKNYAVIVETEAKLEKVS